MKTFLVKALNLLLIGCVLMGYQSYAKERQREVDAHREEEREAKKAWAELEANKVTYMDGKFRGTGTGYGGDVVTEVTIQDGKITAIEVIEGKKETPEYLEAAKKLIPDVVEFQSVDVDVVTNATLSSNAILDGICEALEESKNNEK